MERWKAKKGKDRASKGTKYSVDEPEKKSGGNPKREAGRKQPCDECARFHDRKKRETRRDETRSSVENVRG